MEFSDFAEGELHSQVEPENAMGLEAPPAPGSIEFLADLAEIVNLAEAIHDNDNEGVMMFLDKNNLKVNWEIFGFAPGGGVSNYKQLAHLVAMDAPTDLFFMLVDWLRSKGKGPARLDFDAEDGVPFLSFIETIGVVGAEIATNFKPTFATKAFFNQPRPEHAQGRMFGQYSFDRHASYPAGHGVAAGTVAAVIIHFWQLTNDTESEIYEAARMFSHCRDLAGVHMFRDSEQGFLYGYNSTLERIKAEYPL